MRTFKLEYMDGTTIVLNAWDEVSAINKARKLTNAKLFDIYEI